MVLSNDKIFYRSYNTHMHDACQLALPWMIYHLARTYVDLLHIYIYALSFKGFINNTVLVHGWILVTYIVYTTKRVGER